MPNQDSRRHDPATQPQHFRPKRHFRPATSKRGHIWAPRWAWGLALEGELTRNEALAIIHVADQTKGWKKALNREWVRLTREDWGELLALSPRSACKVRDQLLEKGYLRRRPASEAPEAQESQKRSGYHYTYVNPEARDRLDAIEEAANPAEDSEPAENGSSEPVDARSEAGEDDLYERDDIPF